MADQSVTCRNYKHYGVLGVLLLLVIAAYSSSLNASWHLDDYPTIVHNARLHPLSLSPESLSLALYSRGPNLSRPFRPIACLSLALNWYFGKDRVLGYHVVNIGIHLITTWLLFITVLGLYRSPRLQHIPPASACWISLLTAALWALNPVQTQAVTYIVQRMASMAAMFYLLGCYLYVKARTVSTGRQRMLYFAGCAAAYFLAVGSKENAITLPLALSLVEVAFFMNLENPKNRKKLAITTAVIGVVLVLTGVFMYVNADAISLLNGYRHRSFSLSERLLTEPAVVVFYLTQLFYPIAGRLSIEHDVAVATSLFDPWTTLPAVLLIFFLIGLGLSQIKKRPVLAFAVLFFFLNHVIESSVLPLELVFEHRNYLPSLFIFWPLAAGMIWLISHYHQKHKTMGWILTAFVVLQISASAVGTYVRNMTWLSEKTLWEDAMAKAPTRARPPFNLAKHYYAPTGRLEEALHLYRKSLTLEASTPAYSRAMALNGMASIHYMRQEFDKVLALCQQALEIYPGFKTAEYNRVLSLVRLGRWESASQAADRLLEGGHPRADYLFLKGAILLKLNRAKKALDYLRPALKADPENRKILMSLGSALGLNHQHRQARWFFSRAVQVAPTDIRPYFYLIENSIISGDIAETEKNVAGLFSAFSAHAIIARLAHSREELFLTPPSRHLIAPVVYAKLAGIADGIAGSGLQ